MEIEVKGHSGCHIEIIPFNGQKEFRVIKSTYDKSYTNRLYKQAKKQMAFYNINVNNIYVPKIFEITKKEDFTSFQMEFIYSLNFVDFFEKISVNRIDQFIQTIISFIDNSIDHSTNKELDTKVITEKYNRVKSKIFTNQLLTEDNHFSKIIENTDQLYNITPTMILPLGICHGDLTLSNMLFNGDNICLIDFLDSFVESPIIDIVKIRQDTFYSWSLLMYNGELDRVRMQMIFNYIDKKIDEYFCQYNWYCQYYHLFDIMNLLRILQYAKERKIINFLEHALMKAINRHD